MRIHNWKVTREGDRIRCYRPQRTCYLQIADGALLPIRKDGTPEASGNRGVRKRMPPQDIEAIARAVLEGEL